MVAQYPTAIPSFAGTIGSATDPLSSPSLPVYAQKAADEIVAVTQKVGVGPGKAVTESYASGLWNNPEGPSGSGGMTQDVLYCRRYELPFGTQLTQLGIWVAAAGATAGCVVRLGIYNDDGTGTYPGTLLVDGGVTTADISTTGFKNCTAFTAVDAGGVKWFAMAAQVAAPGANTLSNLTTSGRGMAIATVPNINAMQAYTNTSITGALPGTFGSTRAVSNFGPRIFYK